MTGLHAQWQHCGILWPDCAANRCLACQHHGEPARDAPAQQLAQGLLRHMHVLQPNLAPAHAWLELACSGTRLVLLANLCREVLSPPPRSDNYARPQIVSDLGLLGGHPTDAPLVLGQASDQTTRCTQPHHAHPRSDPLLPLADQSCDQIWGHRAWPCALGCPRGRGVGGVWLPPGCTRGGSPGAMCSPLGGAPAHATAGLLLPGLWGPYAMALATGPATCRPACPMPP